MMKNLHYISYFLLFVGGLNWGLIGFFNYDLVDSFLGMNYAKWVYMLVGLATVYVVFGHKKDCKICGKK